MATDEERREVAGKLRGLEQTQWDEGIMCDLGEVVDALGLVSDDGAWVMANAVEHLADLIDCPNCGAEVER